MRKSKGFTLIELLIVIAIIGILAAVLIPNLLGARDAAIDRAAQAHSANVYKALFAELAENPAVDATAIVARVHPTPVTAACRAGGNIQRGTPPAAGPYGWGAAPGGVLDTPADACNIVARGASDFTVTVRTARATFVNGRVSP